MFGSAFGPARTVLLAAAMVALATPAAAEADGTITVNAGALRTGTNTDAGYAAPAGGVAFQRATWTANPAAAAWLALCVTDATGACRGNTLPNGRYLVREAPAGAPPGWHTLADVAWGGGSTGTSPTRAYAGDVVVDDDNPTAHPSIASPAAPTAAASGPFVVSRDNPPLSRPCGLDVLLLLDRSGSITGFRDTYRDAALAMVGTLAGTATRLKIFSFAGSASADQATFLDLRVPADVATANNVINAVYSATDGPTNWDGAMLLAATAGVDAVVFVTDGNPTARSSATPGANGDAGSVVDLLDLTAGIASANTVRTIGKSPSAGATVIGVGVGSGVTPSNLAAVSGPVANADYYTSSVATLNARLQAIAAQLCPAPAALLPAPAAPPPPPPAATAGSATVTPTGIARLSGRTTCVAKPFTARVTGRGIARVVFLLNGKHIKTITANGYRTVFKVRIRPRRGARKVLRVTAYVTFKPSANTAKRTLRYVYLGCPRRAVSPAFTG